VAVMMVLMIMMLVHRKNPPFSFLYDYIDKSAICQNNYL